MVRNEIDRFGFSSQIQILHNLKYLPIKATCSWVHGWKWYDINDARLLGGYFNSDKYRTKIVTNIYQKKFLDSIGYKNVIVGGLPFAYFIDSPFLINVETFTDRKIIAIAPKSQDGILLRRSFTEFVSSILDEINLRNNVVLCVFSHNAKDPLLKNFIDLNIPIITGANPFNKLDLIRMKSLFLKFDFMITNTIGSHIPYCASLGLKVKVSTPFDERSFDDLILNHSYAKNDSTYLDYLIHVHSKRFFIDNFKNVFPLNNFSNDITSWGRTQIGIDHLLSTDEIYELFGWTLKGKVRSFKESIISKLHF